MPLHRLLKIQVLRPFPIPQNSNPNLIALSAMPPGALAAGSAVPNMWNWANVGGKGGSLMLPMLSNQVRSVSSKALATVSSYLNPSFSYDCLSLPLQPLNQGLSFGVALIPVYPFQNISYGLRLRLLRSLLIWAFFFSVLERVRSAESISTWADASSHEPADGCWSG